MKFLEILRARLAELVEQRSARVAELEAITAGAEAEQRAELTDDESASFEEVRAQIDELDTEIDAVRQRIEIGRAHV